MKTFQEFLEESALARLALKGVGRVASRAGRVARTADGGTRITSAARRARTATPRATMTRAERGETFKSVGDKQVKKTQIDPKSKFFDPVKQKEYTRQTSYWGNKDRTVLSGAAPRDRNITIARSAAKKAGFSGGGNKNRVDFNTKNTDYTTYPDKYPDGMSHPKSNTQVDTQIETLPSGRVAAAKSSGSKQPEPVKRPKASLGTFYKTQRRVPSTDEIARNMKEYLRRVKKTGGNERQPVHKVDFIQRSDATLPKNEMDKYAMKRGRNFVKAQKDLPKNLEKAGAKQGDIISGQPSPMMSGERAEQGIKQREKMYARRYGRRVQPLDPTGRVRGMIGAVGGDT